MHFLPEIFLRDTLGNLKGHGDRLLLCRKLLKIQLSRFFEICNRLINTLPLACSTDLRAGCNKHILLPSDNRSVGCHSSVHEITYKNIAPRNIKIYGVVE